MGLELQHELRRHGDQRALSQRPCTISTATAMPCLRPPRCSPQCAASVRSKSRGQPRARRTGSAATRLLWCTPCRARADSLSFHSAPWWGPPRCGSRSPRRSSKVKVIRHPQLRLVSVSLWRQLRGTTSRRGNLPFTQNRIAGYLEQPDLSGYSWGGILPHTTRAQKEFRRWLKK